MNPLNDEAISFSTLRRYEAMLAAKDRQIGILTELLRQAVEEIAALKDAQG